MVLFQSSDFYKVKNNDRNLMVSLRGLNKVMCVKYLAKANKSSIETDQRRE